MQRKIKYFKFLEFLLDQTNFCLTWQFGRFPVYCFGAKATKMSSEYNEPS